MPRALLDAMLAEAEATAATATLEIARIDNYLTERTTICRPELHQLTNRDITH